MEPFWPRKSPHFLACRRPLRPLPTPATIGLSGGPDSLALVAAAAAERKDVRAVVVEHGLQPGSADVAERAAAQAEALGVPAEVVRVDVAPGNVEAKAREARYAALVDATLRRQSRTLWVAHTADDQAETLLLGALRGNPAGMAPEENLAAGAAGAISLVRPFLSIRRADTVGACKELGLEPWHDPMNDDPAYRRVAVRTRLIPQLTELLGGDAVPALATTANRFAADRQLLEALTDLTPTNDCAALAADPAPARRRRIAAWLLDNGIPVQGDQLDAVERLVIDWRGQGPVHVAGARICRHFNRLEIHG